jgi:hypothetical protein
MSDKPTPEVHELYDGAVVINFHPASHRYYLTHLDGKKLPRQRQLGGVTSITGLLDKSRALMPWATRMYTEKVVELLGEDETVKYSYQEITSMLSVGEVAHTEKKEAAATVGDYVHKFAEEYSKDKDAKAAYERTVAELGDPSEENKKKIDVGVVGLVDWLKKEKVEIESAESLVYSKEYDYVGTYDAIVVHNGKRYLTDYKTSGGIYNEHYYQSAAYLKAYEEETGDTLDGVLIVAIVKEDKEDKDGNIIKTAGQIIPEFRERDVVDKDHAAFKGLVALKEREKELQREYYQKTKK